MAENGIDTIRKRVEAQFEQSKAEWGGFDQDLLAEIEHAFAPPAFKRAGLEKFNANLAANGAFRAWCDTNLSEHRDPEHAIVLVTHYQRLLDDELRISHEQNVILPHVHKSDLPEVYATLRDHGLATANVGLISDIIACPGMDYCALATARSIPIAQEIATRFDELKLEHEIGPLKIKISGCINACGHHHVGHIGILGLDRAGVENYQITLGGDGTETAAIGTRTGPGFPADEIVPAVERLIGAYLDHRESAEETFLQTYRRIGMDPFKAALYPEKAQSRAA